MMRYRKLGKTGLLVSEIGLGGGGIGHVWGRTSDEAVHELIQFAVKEGVNFFDVAPSYGDGRAETNLGRALGEHAPRAVLATKVFLQPDDLDDMAGAAERSLSASLERLQRDSVTLFQLHNPISAERGGLRRSLGLHDVLDGRGAIAALQRLRESGLCRFVGITGMGEAEAVRTVLREGGLDTVQAYYNLLNPSAARPLPPGSRLHDHGQILELTAELDLGVIGIRNLAAGALSAAVDRELHPESLARRDVKRAGRLGFLTGERTPLSRVATRYVLDHPGIHTVVPGAKNVAEIADALLAMEQPPLGDEALAQMETLLAEDFGVREPSDALL